MDSLETPRISPVRGSVADALTVLRALLTPAIMALIIIGWAVTRDAAPGNDVGEDTYARMLGASFLATILFGIAAITDVLDNMLGGDETASYRKFGWFDDVADTILVVGTLAALLYATWTAGAVGLGLMVPAAVIIGREVIIGLVKGYELTRTGWPQTSLGTAKNALAMVSTLLLVASPWLTSIVDKMRFDGTNAMEIYNTPSALVWNVGLIGLWVTAVLSVVTGIMLLRGSSPNGDDVEGDRVQVADTPGDEL